MCSCWLKDDPEENVGNRFPIEELNSNQGFVPEFPHFCLKKQLHSNAHGLKNNPKFRTDECKKSSKQVSASWRGI